MWKGVVVEDMDEALLMESRVGVTVCVYSGCVFNGLVGA